MESGCTFSPEAIFLTGAEHLGDNLSTITDEFALREIIRITRNFSLLPRDPDKATLTPHRLVQQVIRDEMPAEEQRVWMERVVDAVSTTTPSYEFEHWPVLEQRADNSGNSTADSAS
jgi:hypothetical protein